MTVQHYEKYWKYTAALADYNGDKFIGSLNVCVEFIDHFTLEEYSPDKYERLQIEMEKFDLAARTSIRKKINQFVKMGFINSRLSSYHPDTKNYIKSISNEERETLLSKIIYSNSSLNKSVIHDSSCNQINFLINTLVNKRSLSKEEIIGMMLVDVEEYNASEISKEDLEKKVLESKRINFEERKYNQISHFINLLGKLNNLTYTENTLYFSDDAPEIVSQQTDGRDSYLQQLYKNQLKEESIKIYGKPVCMLQKLDYPYKGFFIASHIKPYIECNENEKFDPMNGLLLSLTMDALFDKKLIAFTDEGLIIFSKRIASKKIKEFLSSFKLDKQLLNSARLRYLKFHREMMNKRDMDNV